jgi:twitching motility protein PilT
MNITELLVFSVKNGASDLHLSAGLPPMVRVHGDIRRISVDVVDHKQVHAMVYDVMNDMQRKHYEEFLEVDFSFEIDGLSRFRVNAYNQNRGAAAVFRTIPSKILTLEELSAPKIFGDLALKPRGLVLVTGPTGSGKSTTLAAMINYLNETASGHILTVEDPIEFVHESKKCLVNQREVGVMTHSFANALRSALREDPDAILVGEMRDLETIRLAMTAAETGHLVFGTVHTSSAAKTIDRIIDVFPGEEKEMIRAMLSESLQAVISQTLCKRDHAGHIRDPESHPRSEGGTDVLDHTDWSGAGHADTRSESDRPGTARCHHGSRGTKQGEEPGEFSWLIGSTWNGTSRYEHCIVSLRKLISCLQSRIDRQAGLRHRHPESRGRR